MKRHGFTLIEMLVVISIIAILAAILMPAIAAVRRSAKIAATTSLIRTMSMALEHYGGDFSGFYPPDTIDSAPLMYNGTKLKNGAQALCYFIETQFVSDDGRKSGAYENFKAANKYAKNDALFTGPQVLTDPPITVIMHWNYIVDAFRSPVVYDERKSELDTNGLNTESFVIVSGAAFDKNKGVTTANLDNAADLSMFLATELYSIDTVKATVYADTTPGVMSNNDDLYNN